MADVRQINNMHTPTVPELVAWLATHKTLWYMAPMDLRPSRLATTSRVRTWSNPNRFAVSVKYGFSAFRFRIDEGHLARIYLPDGGVQ